MGRTVYGPDDIPISRERQKELYNGWSELDSEGFFGEIAEDEESLEDRCRTIISELPDSADKKDQIIALYLVLGDEESTISHRVIAEIVGCTEDYARSYTYLYAERVVLERNGIDHDLREQVVGEDGECVRCGSKDNLVVHHIIPYSKGGEDTRENLATLCESCHLDSHGGKWNEVDYNSKDEFWEWARYTAP